MLCAAVHEQSWAIGSKASRNFKRDTFFKYGVPQHQLSATRPVRLAHFPLRAWHRTASTDSGYSRHSAPPSAKIAQIHGYFQPAAKLSDHERRDAAFGLAQRFNKFLEDSCGCSAWSNRAEARRASFHVGKDLDLSDFIEERLHGDAARLESVARMPCPVMIPDKSMLKAKVPESAPKRIIYAAKGLRQHLSLAETVTCRSCDKRSRCRAFKAPAVAEVTTDVGHVIRVIFGMAQYSRAHLQHPEAYPFYFSRESIDSAHFLMDALATHLAESGDVTLFANIGLADQETAREMLLKQAQKKVQLQQAQEEEKRLSMPQWMRESLEPVPNASMGRKQREILEASANKALGSDAGDGEASEVEATTAQEVTKPTRGRRRRRRGQDDEDGDWLEEGSVPGEPVGKPLTSDPVPLTGSRAVAGEGEDTAVDLDAQLPLTVVDTTVEEMPVPQRFRHLPVKKDQQPMRQYNSMLGGHSTGVYRVAEEQMPHRIDLDNVVDEDLFQAAESGDDTIAELQGGYVVVDLLNNDTFANVPQEVLKYVSVSPRALEGVHRYIDVDKISKKRLTPEMVEDCWNRNEFRGKDADELPFLTRVPFDSGVGRSGGSLPPGRLPREMLLPSDAPMKPAPYMGASGQSGEEDGEIHYDVLAADEDLATRALARTLQDGSVAGIVPDAEPPAISRRSSTAGSVDTEDERFAAWASRTSQLHEAEAGLKPEETQATSGPDQPMPPSAVKKPLAPVLQPMIDMDSLGNPRRLERIGEVPEDNDVGMRRRTTLPHDEEFVSTFRRPLVSSDDTEVAGGNPLGSAAPSVDIEAIKRAGAKASMAPREPSGTGLEEDSQYVLGGSLKFPKLPDVRRPTGTSRRPQSASNASHPSKRATSMADFSKDSRANDGPAFGSGHAAVPRLPPRLGRMRQARLGTDLDDLLRPPTVEAGRQPDRGSPVERGSASRSRRKGALGVLERPSGETGPAASGLDRPPQSSSEMRETRNSAMVAQQLLVKQLKNSVRERFPRRPRGHD